MTTKALARAKSTLLHRDLIIDDDATIITAHDPDYTVAANSYVQIGASFDFEITSNYAAPENAQGLNTIDLGGAFSRGGNFICQFAATDSDDWLGMGMANSAINTAGIITLQASGANELTVAYRGAAGTANDSEVVSISEAATGQDIDFSYYVKDDVIYYHIEIGDSTYTGSFAASAAWFFSARVLGLLRCETTDAKFGYIAFYDKKPPKLV